MYAGLVLLSLPAAPATLHAQTPAPVFTRAPAGRTAATDRSGDAPARAAAQRKLDYVPAVRFEEARRRALRSGSQGSPVHVAADQQTSYTLVVRTDTSDAEQHARWDDIIVVRAGRGGIRFGRRAVGGRRVGAGELRGLQLGDTYELPLGPGDVARVPAGVPHAFWRRGNEPLEYLVIKVRRGDRPLDPK